jgi:type II secretory pathway pseudopilin PulG
VGRASRYFLGKRSGRFGDGSARASDDRRSPRLGPREARRARSYRLGGAGPRSRADDGLTLVEVLIAFLILTIILVPIATLLANAIGQAATSRERLTALGIAESCIETLNNEGPPLSQGVPETGVLLLANNTGLGVKATTPTALPTSCMGTAGSVKKSTIAYTVYAEFNWSTAEGDHPDLCTSGAVPSVLDLQVTVDWLKTRKITDTTVINYPPGGILTIGFLAIQVNGDQVTDAKGRSWAKRVQSVPTTITNAGTTPSFSATVYPDDYGCVFEAVPPGKFNVSLGQPAPGTPAGTSFGKPTTPTWVENLDEKTTTVKTTTPQVVNGGEVTDVTFQYDEGSLVNLSYPSSTTADGGVVCPAAGSIQCLAFGQSPTNALKPATTPVADILVKTSSGWSVESQSSAVRLVAAACAGSSRCIAVGTGKTSAASVSSATSTPPSFSADSVPASVTSLSQITCPTSSTCFALGHAGSTPAIVAASVGGGSVSWAKATLATGVTRILSMSCASKTKCYAVATTSKATAPVAILSVSAASTTTWKTTDTLPRIVVKTKTKTVIKTLPSAITQVSCPSTTACYALGKKKTTGTLAIMSLTTATVWKWDTITKGTYSVTALNSITCPSTTSCYVVGTRKKTSTTTGSILYVTAATTWKFATTPSIASISRVTCLSATTCTALGSGPTLMWRTSKKTFGSVTLTSGYTVSALSSTACASATECFATGLGTKSGVTGAIILSGHGTSTWVVDSVPASLLPVFYSGIACTGSVCAAPGGTETAAIVLSDTATSTSWTKGTPSGLQGMYIADAPITVTDASLQPSSPLELVAPTTDKVQIGPLYPFAGGYTVSAGECHYEVLNGSAAVSTVPGGTSTAALPLGILPVEVTNTTGTPLSGFTVTATLSDGTSCVPLTPLSGTNPTSYALGKTDALGMAGIAVIYDTYKVTVTSGAHTLSKTVVVTPTTLVVTGTSQPLPTPVVFPGL